MGSRGHNRSTDKILERALKEINLQLDDLAEDRRAGSPHKTKLASAMANLSRAIVTIKSEQRQAKKDEQKEFEGMTEDELDALLIEHFHGISAERLDKFQKALDEERGEGSILG